MAGQRLNAMRAWQRGFAALERLSPEPDAMTLSQQMDCAAVYFCLIRGQDLEEREQAARAAAQGGGTDV